MSSGETLPLDRLSGGTSCTRADCPGGHLEQKMRSGNETIWRGGREGGGGDNLHYYTGNHAIPFT